MTETKKPRIYSWDPWPFGLYTKKQLSAMGFKPGTVAGLIPYSKSADGDGYLRVYTLIDAQPKKPMTEKQKAALEKAHAVQDAKRRCPQCGRYKESMRQTICDDCDYKNMRKRDRAEARRWARKMLKNGCVILDTETTGLGYAEIVQIAVIDHEGNVLLDTLCKPLNYAEPNEATAIHGITPEMVADAPCFGEVYEQLYPLLHGREVVIYNAGFDVGILNHCKELYRLPSYKTRETHCAMLWYAQFYGEYSHYWGNYKWQRLEGDHSALGDCLATLKLIRYMAGAQ